MLQQLSQLFLIDSVMLRKCWTRDVVHCNIIQTRKHAAFDDVLHPGQNASPQMRISFEGCLKKSAEKFGNFLRFLFELEL
jgi:hypothetical protein